MHDFKAIALGLDGRAEVIVVAREAGIRRNRCTRTVVWCRFSSL